MTTATHRFTLVELLVVVAIIAILAGMLLPALQRARGSARQSSCLNNERQVMLGIFAYQQEFDEYYPWIWRPIGEGSTSADRNPDFPWTVTISGGQSLAPPTVGGEVNWGSVWYCPESLPRLQSGTLTAATVKKYNTSYALPCRVQSKRFGLGGYYGYGNPPVKNNRIKASSRVSALLEVQDANENPLNYAQIVATWPASFGRHGGVGRGANLAFADGHAEAFPHGTRLLALWSDTTTQVEDPFNTDLE